jgi:hypothetical protein
MFSIDATVDKSCSAAVPMFTKDTQDGRTRLRCRFLCVALGWLG